MHPLIKTGSFPSVGTLHYLSKLETGAIIKEIWDAKLFDGDARLELPPDAVVIDAGAHVGIFSLYIQSLRTDRKPIVYAFEPIPAIFEALQANIRSHAAESQVRLFNCGLSDVARTAQFQFYKNATALSSVEDRDAELHAMVARPGIMDVLRAYRPTVYFLFRYLPFLRPLITQKLMQNLLAKEAVACPVRTLSDVIADQKLERIDFLKIDVERSELPILKGIAAKDWPKIQRIAIENHVPDERAVITTLLEAQGFIVSAKPAVDEYFMIYASRPQ